MKNKLEYFICLFLYALKGNTVSKNTLFRYVYIFDVVNEYFGNFDRINEEIIIDKDMGVGNIIELTNALNEIARRNYITIKGAFIYMEADLITYIDSIKNRDKVKEDLNKIMYFVGIVLSYSEDVILSAFFNEPNVENTISRGKNKIELSNNKLKNLLEEFEQQANDARENKLDKYDVFSSWLDFVFEEYLQEKSNE
ncbi:MAG: hypothetical protein NC300_05835 [Bacteroidales bacterium]|nr:hypothetical protein [Clostridium sp.]MCM1203643.1 hypothetical protein [Bacteroidales bacterium]